MPFEIVRNDITNMQVDAIVNTANPRPIIGSGTDTMVHQKAGPRRLLAWQKIGDIARGSAAITPAYNLNAQYVIHTVGPVWLDGTQGEEDLLRSCYDNSLKLALEHDCHSIAFPLISTGNYGFPKDKALQIAIAAFSTFLLEHEMQIYLVVFNRDAYRLSEKLFHSVASYIDENFVDACELAVAEDNRRWSRRRRELYLREKQTMQEERMQAPCAASISELPCVDDLDSFLKKKDTGFVEALLDLIKKNGHKNSTIYKRANMSKQHFSKLINNPSVNPTKPTAIALALALELDLGQTKDLIGRAGYTLTNSSIFDLIIQYYIEHKSYNVVEINITLYEFDQSLLGSV